jgi:signal recognition particle GTPase
MEFDQETVDVLKGAITEAVEPLAKEREGFRAELESRPTKEDMTKALAEHSDAVIKAVEEKLDGLVKTEDHEATRDALEKALEAVETLRTFVGANGVRKSTSTPELTATTAAEVKKDASESTDDAFAKAIQRSLPTVFGGEGVRIEL